MAGKKINLTDQLKNYFGFDTFKGNQEAIIQNLLAGNDTFVLMPTGGGKSLCYQLPSLLMDGTAIVISPLIALMKNQVDAMRNFSEEDGIAHFINSSLNKSAIDQVKSDILAGRTKLLYVAPESLTKEENVEFLKTVKISFYAVDEAHCISEWGHDFRPEYRRIRPIINEIGKAPLIALTATATPKVQHDIQKNLGMVEAQVFKSSFNRPNLYYEVRPKTANVDKDIIKFIKNNPEKSGIIYCLSRKKVEELAEILQANGINARAYHAGMDSATRTQNQDDFLMEKIDVIVATIAFGMGIDKPDVRYVIHYDIPKSLEGYYQETGRAGREGVALSFVSGKEAYKLKDIERYCKTKIKAKPIPSMDDVKNTKLEAIFSNIKETIEAGGLSDMVEAVEDRLNMEDYTCLDVAAALLKMVVGDSLEDREELEQVHYDLDADRRGMVRLFINVGKKDKIKPANILGAITGESGIPGKLVGSIDMLDNYTFVEVPSKYADAVLLAMENVTIKGRKISMEKAKGTGRKKKKKR